MLEKKLELAKESQAAQQPTQEGLYMASTIDPTFGQSRLKKWMQHSRPDAYEFMEAENWERKVPQYLANAYGAWNTLMPSAHHPA